METDAGDWTNRSFADVIAEAPEQFAKFANAEPDFAFPGGESFVAQEERVRAALDEIEQGALPALVVCHGMVIRAALSVRIGRWLPNGQRVPNGAIVPLEPSEAELAEIGRSAGDAGELSRHPTQLSVRGQARNKRRALAGHSGARNHQVKARLLRTLTRERIHVRIEGQSACLVQQALRRKRFQQRRAFEIPVHEIHHQHRRRAR